MVILKLLKHILEILHLEKLYLLNELLKIHYNMDCIYCNFDQKLSLSDISTLCNVTCSVIPISNLHHLISNTHAGLHKTFSNTKEYLQIKTILNNMFITIFQKCEGNQLILKKPITGHQYTIRNTGPFPWEKGDHLTIIPPLYQSQTKVLSLGDWDLTLPLIVPIEIAVEINIRFLCLGLLSIHRNYEDVKVLIDEFKQIQYRDITINLPEIINDTTSINDMKSVCIALSIITEMAPDIATTYINRLSLEDHSMILVKCQELLSKKTIVNPNTTNVQNISILDEFKKIRTVLTMINQIQAVIAEKTYFIICDVTADNKYASCIYKGQ
ncbi:capsid triplex subunit 2 [Murid herpesvirus 3]|uniref:Capsid triplex subunit 2 n=2 Tax=Murid betaherpesvirus 3 TaxID=2560603 RepID=A0A1P8VIY1_9BETA|nr:capsid triplex subunit 2 [Murine roseolovirus]APZ76287.1 capsid triplex subunit 2 [Murid betaherpesvirus 3]AYH64758.1 capsid triplex subunit 2 [Murid herpesvirus 3]